MPKIYILGEAWGEAEERLRLPFQGPSGYELNRMLKEAGIERSDCILGNVFNLRPTPTNDIENLCGPRSAVSHDLPPLRQGKYILDKYLPEVERCLDEINSENPNLILALGNTAAWALLADPRISKIRGTVALGNTGHKVLPTYHPVAVLRQWELRHVTVLDFMKARRESEYPDVRRPQRFIYVPDTISEIWNYYHEHLLTARTISVDIETAAEQITCIGFAPSHSSCLVVPFSHPARGGNYWASLSDELAAWNVVRTILGTSVPKVFQNGLYDLHYIWRRYGIVVNGAGEDTMLLHHALLPESEKGLGFLGSVYTNEPAWKLMRKRTKEHFKKEDE